MLAGAPVSASAQNLKEKDRCELKQDTTDLTAACQNLPRKNTSSPGELTRNRGILPER
jgi:hypothetical protein